MKTYINKAIDPSGWLDMNDNHDTAEFAEYNNMVQERLQEIESSGLDTKC